MASTDVLHMSCAAGQSVFVCMRDPFLEPAACLNTHQLFIYTLLIVMCPKLISHTVPYTHILIILKNKEKELDT